MSIREANERDAAAAAAAATAAAGSPSKQKLIYAAAIIALVAIAFGTYSYLGSPARRPKQGKSKSFLEDQAPPIDAPAGLRSPHNALKSV